MSIRVSDQIFLLNMRDGVILKKFGTTGGSSQFNSPGGITIHQSYLYVCDVGNDRIQIVEKKKGKFINQWKGFNSPRCIYFHDEIEIFFVGDAYSVQLFTKDNICVQRLDFRHFTAIPALYFTAIPALCVFDDRLYVADFRNDRIQIFE